jgi:hypothetical protein
MRILWRTQLHTCSGTVTNEGLDGRGFFAAEPVCFNSRQERLTRIARRNAMAGVPLPEDGQHYFVGLLKVAGHAAIHRKAMWASLSGEFAVEAAGARVTT